MLVLLGLLLGWALFHPGDAETLEKAEAAEHAEHSEDNKATIWTCSMHPQIRMDHPGKCPICGMDLIPLSQGGTAQVDPDAVSLTKEAAALANVMTTVVSKQNPVKEIRLYGKVQADERLYQSQVAHVPGRIESLAVNFTGEVIRRGQVLAEIYSPELITAEQELIETAKAKQLQPELYEASKEKLRQWKLSEEQINEIEASGRAINNFKVLSNTSGTVTARRVNAGDHVAAGTVLFEIADLSRVWVLFDAYESDLQFLSIGKKITFNLQALPGEEFTGRIAFIDPVIDPATRVARVRVETSNEGGRLKPEMFATGIVSSSISNDGKNIVIPRSAVLWTGKRSIVYVKQPGQDEPAFKLREVELGPALGDSYVVASGLSEGEEIVTNGTFSVDASAQLAGKPSMMNPSGGAATAVHHHGDDMEMKTKPSSGGTTQLKVSDVFRKQMNNVYDSYLGIKNALVQSNGSNASKASKAFLSALAKTDMKLLDGTAHMEWMELLEKMKKTASDISTTGSVDEQRSSFSSLSDQMYEAVKAFGLIGKTAYYQFCPMYNNNKGAYWLSEMSEIKNPYYGDEMLTCGETREKVKF